MHKLAAHLGRYLPLLAFVCASIYVVELSGRDALIAFELNSVTGIVSLLLLVLTLGTRALIWHMLARGLGTHLPLSISLQSQFRPVLAKYIPGKVWGYLNTAAILHCCGISYQRSAMLTLMYQVLIVAGALVLTGYGLMGRTLVGTTLWTLTWVATSIVCTRMVRRLGVWKPLRALGGKLRIGPLAVPDWRTGVLLVGLSAINWLLIGVGFLLFFAALGVEPGVEVVFLQPLANVAGALAIFAPGGLGVREFATAGYLKVLGVEAATALAVALWARIWFLAAEALVYLAGLGLHLRQRNTGGAGTP